ncbi:U3 small nucleolar RNA-associated protein 15 homolog [Eumeta japonica]|uniref:U3 small nucleolar RNA-associated protein 15 homolog n=1 Tax=Eumeta variegata TaxID=151549 RepID=A0A4C1V6I1_EUMVA|nr:U3 small nucleolar RNA-associated protein 15 homolog [Eumeta japonica]
MSLAAFPFKKTSKTLFHKPASVTTEDSLYWKKLGSPVLVKEFGAIDYLDFSPLQPYYFAATCSVRIQIYNPITKLVAKNLSKFVKGAYGGCFRSDGRLLVAGSEESAIKLFDVQSKNVLRIFTGHTAPVHRTFFTKDKVKIISFSDDKSVGLWDIATETKILTFSEHNDYVRAGSPSPISPDLILSGGYDNILKLYDCRQQGAVLTVNHGSPVESTLFLPSGGIFISAGGTEIKVWDILNGGKLLANISQHHKTVTTLRLASNNSRLMSASLDRHVKIYDIANFNVVHNIDYPNAILSMAISDNDEVLTVGMVDGVISIRKRDELTKDTGKRKVTYKFAPDLVQNNVDEVVMKAGKQKYSQHDIYLRKMEYNKALCAVLKTYVTTKHPEVTASLIQELLRRNTLHLAMIGLEDKHISSLLKYFIKNLGETRCTRVIIDAANVFIDIYDSQVKFFSEQNALLYTALKDSVSAEVDVCKRVCEIEGVIGLLLAGAEVNSISDEIDVNHIFTPSSKAQRDLVIDV